MLAKYGSKEIFGLLGGAVACALLLLLPVPAGMPQAAMYTAAVTALMVIWWVTEAIPIPATALIPLVAFPLLGVMDSEAVARHYADHNIFLFLGGFLIALSVEKWGLHRRLALQTIRLFGTSPRMLVLGFMVASATISMWVSNTATALMMLPIASAVLSRFRGDPVERKLGVALLLGLAYGASVGGIGTLVGTPPNIVLAGSVKQLLGAGAEIGFGRWMLLAVPLVMIMIPLIWLVLVRLAVQLPAGHGGVALDISSELRQIGRLGRGEKIVLAVFGLTAAGWVLRRPLLATWAPGITDATIAMAGALLLFVIPVNAAKREFALDWDQTRRLPWGVLLLFGGGFALAAGMEASGLAQWLSQRLQGLQGLPVPLVVLLICLLMLALTEVSSNTATTITMLPVLAAAGGAMGVSPLPMMIAATMSASCAFMLPVSTPPNAIVFGTGRIRMAEMFRIGLWLELLGAAAITLLVCTLGPVIFAGGR